MNSGLKKVVLIIADISGYTRYMLANRRDLEHGQSVITELIKTIIKEVEIPLEVSKLEGDAVFMYAIEGEAWNREKKLIGDRLPRFFHAFRARLDELKGSTDCICGACANIDKLRLKLIVHAGEAIFYEIAGFTELSGVDVIIVHRLLKNSVSSNQYILITEQALDELEVPSELVVYPNYEEYPEIGRIKTYVHFPSM
ncbi:DUF2652 domain-containing protein [bacterium]|nr:DUF2652 domain-containing protein [bacterium]